MAGKFSRFRKRFASTEIFNLTALTRLYVEQVANDHIFMELRTYLEAYPTLLHAFIGSSVM